MMPEGFCFGGPKLIEKLLKKALHFQTSISTIKTELQCLEETEEERSHIKDKLKPFIRIKTQRNATKTARGCATRWQHACACGDDAMMHAVAVAAADAGWWCWCCCC